MDIEAWLQGLGLERYVPAFRDNEIDWEVLPKLTSDDSGRSALQQSATGASCWCHRYARRLGDCCDTDGASLGCIGFR